jgi:hypothetical protein
MPGLVGHPTDRIIERAWEEMPLRKMRW